MELAPLALAGLLFARLLSGLNEQRQPLTATAQLEPGDGLGLGRICNL
jgi:hypothetical protein